MARKKKIFGWRRVVLVLACLGVAAGGAIWFMNYRDAGQTGKSLARRTAPKNFRTPVNPLENRTFYVDDTLEVAKLAAQYRREGKNAEADLAQRIASQPEAVWLTGPSVGDPKARSDINKVRRTSEEAKSQGAVPVYQLYAIPRRDACAAYSQGGFATSAQYLAWLEQILGALKTDAVFIVEADAIAQTVKDTCLSPQQKAARYKLIKAALERLRTAPYVIATYVDAGHSEWFPNPSVLVGPLRKAGIDKARGVAVNISNFIDTTTITNWSERLVKLLGGNRGVIIDTSRNGRGSPPPHIKGVARWCNPLGRGVGPRPTTNVPDLHVDAYFWIKTVGESDGACFGKPQAGTFMPEVALELSRNASP